MQLFAGQSRLVTLSFRTSDGATATDFMLAAPSAGLPAGWTIGSSRCVQVEASGQCQVALTYAPGAAEPSAATELHLDSDLSALPAGWTSASAGLGCPSFSTGSSCQLHLSYAPAAAAPEPVTSCRIADDNALVDCADSGVVFDRLTNLDVNQLGAFVLAVPAAPALPIPHLTRCALSSDGGLDGNSCRIVDPKTSDLRIPTAMISANDMVYVSASNFSTVQTLYSCALADDGLKCSSFGLGAPQQIIQRMSRGQAGEQAYLYLAGTSRTDPQKAPGAIFKCALDADGLVSGCDRAARPQGIAPDDLIRISDIRIVGTTAYLITGRPDTDRKIYQCPVDQKTGDLPACVSAGAIEGMDPSSIAVR